MVSMGFYPESTPFVIKKALRIASKTYTPTLYLISLSKELEYFGKKNCANY